MFGQQRLILQSLRLLQKSSSSSRDGLMSTRQEFRLRDFVLFDTGVEQRVKSAAVKLSSAGSKDSMDLSRSDFIFFAEEKSIGPFTLA